MKTRIVVDSTADILPEYLDRLVTKNTSTALPLIIAHFIKN